MAWDIGAYQHAASGGSAGTATGAATASGVGAALAATAGSAAGAATASGVGAELAASAGSATGAATAAGVGASTSGAAAGQANGAATAFAVGASLNASAGTAIGVATASAVAAVTGGAADGEWPLSRKQIKGLRDAQKKRQAEIDAAWERRAADRKELGDQIRQAVKGKPPKTTSEPSPENIAPPANYNEDEDLEFLLLYA
jgi:hypothetical protein